MIVAWCVLFKQKTAYEMRISDWSSDVCSSDLAFLDDVANPPAQGEDVRRQDGGGFERDGAVIGQNEPGHQPEQAGFAAAAGADEDGRAAGGDRQRSEARRVGNEGVSTFRSRWSPYR